MPAEPVAVPRGEEPYGVSLWLLVFRRCAIEAAKPKRVYRRAADLTRVKSRIKPISRNGDNIPQDMSGRKPLLL
jgi:hypothetical protein